MGAGGRARVTVKAEIKQITIMLPSAEVSCLVSNLPQNKIGARFSKLVPQIMLRIDVNEWNVQFNSF